MPIANPVYQLMVLCLLVVLSEYLVRRSFMRHFGTALLVILLTAIVANLGLLPAGSSEEQPVPVYEGIFAYLAPLSIFWLLLRVNLKDILQAGLPMLSLFILGALGTAIGVFIGMRLLNGPETIGPLYHAVGGMFLGTYTGGSVNFNAVAIHYDVMREGVLYGGAVAVDNIITAVWMVATIAIPRLLQAFWRRAGGKQVENGAPSLGIEEDTETLHPIDLGLILALGFGCLWLSNWLAELIGVPAMLVLTVFALIIAQLPLAKRLQGAQLLGMFSVYLFLAVIGAFCNLQALGELGNLGLILLGFAAVTVLMHGLIIFGGACLLGFDLGVAAVASQANIGGSTSALALARSLGRNDLVLPAVLLGSLGIALGTFLGFLASEQLLPAIFGKL